MNLSSPAFGNGEMIPAKYSRRGRDISPPLNIEDIPAGAKSLALICNDPDAAKASGFTHWLVWNIPPSTQKIAEGSVPDGAIQGLTDWGENKWGGPQPPSGMHRYFFTLYALDSLLNIPSSSDKSALEAAMEGYVISSATLMGTYNSNKA